MMHAIQGEKMYNRVDTGVSSCVSSALILKGVHEFETSSLAIDYLLLCMQVFCIS